jgi:nucleoside-specific outer membrane channel protein Tsx
MKKTLLTMASAALLSTSVQAEQYWADNSVSILNGSSYIEPFANGGAPDPDNEISYTTLTLEHVSGHSWGGLFYFVDRHSGEGFTDTYIEFSPTYTLAKMDGAVSSVSAAYTLESGGGFDNHLFGASVGLSVPGMDYLNVNLYRAINDKIGFDKGDDNLLSVIYGYSNGNLIIDGFMDYRFGNDDGVEDSMNLTPQITYNLAPMLGLKNKLKVGVEYSYWTNKFGVDGADQNVVSLLIKAHL